ncbi:Nudix hydrolase 20 [Durusdinium trenchii]|uniref:Chloroplastic (AtNUDT20) n=1 Tax=Durusdinium trenchii TaxID=1381693 RepID=A0ABP0SC36_9DINO
MLWVARRSRSKPTYPGCLDHLVAGGLSHGEVPQENVKRECWEEARVPEEISSSAQPCGVVSYVQVDETGWGIKRDVLFCYDLQLPEDFEPHAGDGEVESFSLMSLEDVVDSLAAEGAEPDWKPNVCLVILDMLVRRGVLQPEEDGYVELVHGLRRSS